MRTITLIVIHCSATPEGRGLDAGACRLDHVRNRHFSDIGYHYYVTRDGIVHAGRPPERVGAHCKGHNRRFPRALVVGHRDLDPMKDCPCFDAAREYN